ncbi:MAG: GTP 3',8-cyclase MoaA [Oscillospiraceae bacterium]
MLDSYNREIEYLRVSVTGRCNLACKYCHPQQCDEHVLSFDEIEKICAAAAELGIKKIRLTGGEPLVRPNLPKLVSAIHNIKGVEHIALTTNAVLLKEQLPALLAAGISKINISLDTLDAALFKEITGMDKLSAVLEGIEAAVDAGVQVRINCVPLYEHYQEQVSELCSLADRLRVDIRFIELMPMGDAHGLKGVSNSELLELLKKRYSNWQAHDRYHCDGPAQYYSFEGIKGRIGMISPMSHAFCGDCNRIRLTAEGFLRTCLGSDDGVDLKAVLQSGGDLKEAIKKSVYAKPACHHFNTAPCTSVKSMAQIGG